MIGKIVKGIAGFYYVYVAGSGIYQCRAKGLFRLEGKKPLVGDDVEIELTKTQDVEGSVVRILPRRSELARPAAANVDQALILFSVRFPKPNLGLLDRFLISVELRGIPCRIGISKVDAARPGELEMLKSVYEKCGHPLHFISVKSGEGMEELKEFLRGRTTVLAGPSGVGKSSLTNAVAGAARMEIGEISKKLARGKNTTRHSELVPAGENTFLCDTPGFSALDAAGLPSGELWTYYEEFAPFQEKCRFNGCVHIDEPDCAVKEALANQAFSPVRYENYRQIYMELKDAERRRYQ